MGNAVIGGITVWAGLNPWSVAGHFLLANCLLTVAVITWVRIGEGDGAPRPRAPARCGSCPGPSSPPRSC